jgi:hypothetical protein
MLFDRTQNITTKHSSPSAMTPFRTRALEQLFVNKDTTKLDIAYMQ